MSDKILLSPIGKINPIGLVFHEALNVLSNYTDLVTWDYSEDYKFRIKDSEAGYIDVYYNDTALPEDITDGSTVVYSVQYLGDKYDDSRYNIPQYRYIAYFFEFAIATIQEKHPDFKCTIESIGNQANYCYKIKLELVNANERVQPVVREGGILDTIACLVEYMIPNKTFSHDKLFM